MELSRKEMDSYSVTFLILIVFECGFCRQVSNGAGTLPLIDNQDVSTIQDPPHHYRTSKQFLYPVVVWPYSLGINVQDRVKTQLPTFVLPEYYSSGSIAVMSPAAMRDEKFSNEEGESDLNHARDETASKSSAITPCKTENNEVGICQSFTKCFPMMEIQYGSEIYTDYMNVPLAEQIIRSTNATVCSQNENVEENLKVCCSHSSKTSKALLDGKTDETEKRPEITQRPPLRNSWSRRLVQELKCGNSLSKNGSSNRSQGKITGGQEAKGPYEFPWMVAVFGKNQKIFCGASLITDQFLISAAHCFSTFKPDDLPHLYVHLGDFNLKTNTDGPHEVRKIERIIIHSGFRIENYHNDIALLKLTKPVNFTDRVRPICLPEATMDTLEGRRIIVTGWGRKYRYGSTSDVLRKVEMPVWNLQECKSLYSRFAPGRVLDSNFCAGDGKRNKDACLGDSGGPAVMFDGEKFVLVGIVSWGKGCASFPGVYTKTSSFLMWITKLLNKFA